MKVRSGGILAAVVLLAGCESPSGPACTLIGCVSGLTIELEAPLVSGTEVIIRGSAGPEWRLVCGEDVVCSGAIFLPDYFPESVTVTTRASIRETVYHLEPEYVESQPNGAQCPPICRNGTVLLENAATETP